MKYLIYALLPALLLSFSACTSPAENVANHFNALTEIAKGYPSDCDAMGKALNDYLNTNKDSFTKSVNNTSSSTPEESLKLYRASFALHEATHNCNNESVEVFRTTLAEITLKAANVKPKSTQAANAAAQPETTQPALN